MALPGVLSVIENFRGVDANRVIELYLGESSFGFRNFEVSAKLSDMSDLNSQSLAILLDNDILLETILQNKHVFNLSDEDAVARAVVAYLQDDPSRLHRQRALVSDLFPSITIE